MPQIIRDGLRRGWWVYALAAAGCLFSVLDHNSLQTQLTLTAGVLLYACGALFVFDLATPGKFRALNMFPMTHRQIGLAYGILWVGLVPAFHMVVYLAARLVHGVVPKLVPEELPLCLYGPLMVFCVGMSCAFIMIAQFSQHFQPGWIKTVSDFCSSYILFVLFVLIGYFIYRLGLPAESEPLPPEHPFATLVHGMERLIGPKHSLCDIPEIVALGVAAGGIAVFVVRAEDSARFLFSASTTRGSDYPLTVFSGKSDRTYGFLEPWVQEMRDGVRITGLFAFSCVALYLLNWIFGNHYTLSDFATAQWPLILILIAALVCTPPMIPWLIGMRTLRMLPFSRKGLTLYLISFPLLAFMVYSLVLFALCVHFRDEDYALNMEWWMVIVFGLSLLSVGPMLMSRHTFVTVVILFLPTLVTVILAYKNNHPVETMQHIAFWFKAGAGITLVVAGYLLLHAVLARSAPYRSKPWIGGIGSA
jgi:uncharacterized integral membrane protein